MVSLEVIELVKPDDAMVLELADKNAGGDPELSDEGAQSGFVSPPDFQKRLKLRGCREQMCGKRVRFFFFSFSPEFKFVE